MNNGEIRAFIETYKNIEEDSKYEFSGSQILQIVKALEQQPSDETIKYLECNDIDVQKFTEDMKKQRLQVIKPNICDDCISRQAVIDMTGLSNWFESSDDYNSFVEDLCKLPPVTPTQCIAAVRFSKDDLREICNERIEIECTHGTCKDCIWWKSEDGKVGYCNACKHGHCSGSWDIGIYRKTKDDFYCADYQKRGDSDDSN